MKDHRAAILLDRPIGLPDPVPMCTHLRKPTYRPLLGLGLLLLVGSGCSETRPALDWQGQQEFFECGRPETAVTPTGSYRNQGLSLDYERLVPRPDPRRNVDQAAVARTVTEPARLEQVYYDATHGNRRAAWLACGFDAAARSSGRTIAEKLAGIRCQVLMSCPLDFKRAPISTETASGQRILTLTIQSLEAESRRLHIRQELILRTAQLVVGVQLARQMLREVTVSAPPPVRRVDAKALVGVRGTGPVRQFPTFEAFKQTMGPSGPGKHWHHIVEQTERNVLQFGASRVHSTDNIIAIDEQIHRKISAYYSSKPRGPGTPTVREVLRGKSFDEQYAFGLAELRRHGVIP